MKVFGKTPIFAQDNAPCHVAKSTMHWLKMHNLHVLEGFPPYSPEINIMENCWAAMAKQLAGVQARNKSMMWAQVIEAKKAISEDYIKKLFSSLKARLQAIAAAKGSHTRY